MNSETVLIDTWERGAGITQACGTGACAVVVAGVISGRLARSCTARVLGGELQIRWDEKTGHVFMTGEAVDVYEGVWPES
jgi:diaminopimelate epimerase